MVQRAKKGFALSLTVKENDVSYIFQNEDGRLQSSGRRRISEIRSSDGEKRTAGSDVEKL